MVFHGPQPSVTAASRRANRRRPTAWEIGWATISKPIGAVSVLLIAGLVLAEIFVPAARSRFESYPLSTSFLTFFITVIFTANVINQVITKSLQMRWERVRSIAMQGLNSELRVARDLLYILEYGTVPFDATDPIAIATEKRVPAKIHRIMVDTDTGGLSAKLIGMLVLEDEWISFARDILSEVSVYIRQSLARWSPLLSIGAEVNEASHSMILNSVYLADAISILELPLATERLERGILPARTRGCFVELWRLVAAAFVFVEETSANALRPSLEQPEKPVEFWHSAMRNKLTRSSCEYLKRWEKEKESVQIFQQDILQARDELEVLQLDMIDLTVRDVGSHNNYRENGGESRDGFS